MPAWISIAVPWATLGALGVAIWQTVLTHRAVDLAKSTLKMTEDAVKDTHAVLQAQMLTDAHVLTHVMVRLEGWEGSLSRTQERLEDARREADVSILKAVAEAAEGTPEGLIHRPMYDACPPWLKELYGSGAQHYYQGQCSVRWLWNFKKDEPTVSVERDLGLGDNDLSADGLKSSLQGLRSAIRFLDRLLPEFWLETPAVIDLERFLDR